MTKLAKVQAARPVARIVARPAVAPRSVRKADSVWVEIAEHVVTEKFPLVAIAIEVGKSLRSGRPSLRALLLVAALAI
jgi:hypothetical protein